MLRAFVLTLVVLTAIDSAFGDCPGCTSEDIMCGPNCLLVICDKLGVKADLSELAGLAGKDERGTTLAGLYKAARAKGLHAMGVKIGVDELAALAAPSIAHLWDSHFVVVEAGDAETIRVTDPPGEPTAVPKEYFRKFYSGFALLVADNDSAFPKTEACGPDLRFSNYICDLGPLDPDQVHQHAVRLSNVGNEDLLVSKVESSCSCVLPASWPTTIPSGGTGEVELVFDPTDLDGWVARKLYVSTNDPVTPLAQIDVTAYVKSQRLRLLPHMVYLGQLKRTQSASRTLYVPSTPEEPIEIETVVCDSRFIIPAVSRSTEKDRPGHLVTLTLRPGAPLGEMGATLTIVSNHPKQPKAEVPVTATILGDIDLDRDSFFLGMLKKGDEKKAAVTVSTVSKNPLEIGEIDNPLDYLSIDVAPKVEGKEYVLTATLNGDAPLGNIKSEVVIHTNDPNQPQIKVPVYAYIEE